MIEVLAVIILIILGLVVFILLQKQKITKLTFVNKQLVAQNQAQEKEIDNAKERKQVQHTINQLNQSDVDQRLHDQSYYRD